MDFFRFRSFKAVRKRGFTLIELLLVIAIISLLASVILSNAGEARKRGRDAARLSYIKQIQLGIELYYDEEGTYPILFPPDSRAYLTISSGDVGWSTLENTIRPYIHDLPDERTAGGYLYRATNSGQKYGLAVWFEGSGYANLVTADGGAEPGYYEIGSSPAECFSNGKHWWDDVGPLNTPLYCP